MNIKINPKSIHFRFLYLISLAIFVGSCIQEFIRGFDAFKIEKSFIEPILWIYFAIPICGMYLSFRFILPIWALYILFLFTKLYISNENTKHLIVETIVVSFVLHITLLFIGIPLYFTFLVDFPKVSIALKHMVQIANWPIILVHTFMFRFDSSIKGIWLPGIGAASPLIFCINIIFWALLGATVGSLTSLLLKCRKER